MRLSLVSFLLLAAVMSGDIDTGSTIRRVFETVRGKTGMALPGDNASSPAAVGSPVSPTGSDLPAPANGSPDGVAASTNGERDASSTAGSPVEEIA